MVLGGAKVTDKIGVIERFLEVADAILIGGAMCFSFFRAQGQATGDSLVEEEGVELAQRALDERRDRDCELQLPDDLVIGRPLRRRRERRELDGTTCRTAGWASTSARAPRGLRAAIGEAARTVFWNGPMGAFELEPFAPGPAAVAEAVAGRPGTRSSAAATRPPRWPLRPGRRRRLALDRRRRVARADRGQAAAGRGGAR